MRRTLQAGAAALGPHCVLDGVQLSAQRASASARITAS